MGRNGNIDETIERAVGLFNPVIILSSFLKVIILHRFNHRYF